MIGSILGDIAGSVYEFRNIKTKEFPFLTPQKGYTDDSILTLATADWLLHGGDCATYYFRYATRYPCPLGGFGGRFREWLHQGQQTGQLRPYGSCGNGSAMRVGPVGWAFPPTLRMQTMLYLPTHFQQIVTEFERKFGPEIR